MKRSLSPQLGLEQSKRPRSACQRSGDLNISTLLDFTQLSTTHEIRERFDDIAKSLLHEHILCIATPKGEASYAILEIEMYLKKEAVHEDPFTHASDEQRVSGNWYFHRVPGMRSVAPSATTSGDYKGGSRKGLDLTMGAKSHPRSSEGSKQTPNTEVWKSCHGGILLRSLLHLASQQVTSGPSLIVDEILTKTNASNIAELVKKQWGGDISAFNRESEPLTTDTSRIFLRDVSSTEWANKVGEPAIYASPRIGLDLSHSSAKASPDNLRVQFVTKPYRYFVRPKLLTANGRFQTFCGALTKFEADWSLSRKARKSEICAWVVNRTGLKLGTVERYFDSVQLGMTKKSLQRFIGASGKGVMSSPALYLEMVGTLKTVLENTEESEVNYKP